MNESNPVEKSYVDNMILKEGEIKMNESNPVEKSFVVLFVNVVVLTTLVTTFGLFYWALMPELISVPVGNLIKFASGCVILLSIFSSFIVTIAVLSTLFFFIADKKDKNLAKLSNKQSQKNPSWIRIVCTRMINVCFIVGIAICGHPWLALFVALNYSYQVLGTLYINWSYKEFVKKMNQQPVEEEINVVEGKIDVGVDKTEFNTLKTEGLTDLRKLF